MNRGFPSGARELELPASHYENIYKNDKSSARAHWYEHPARTVTWYPALLLAKGPILDLGCGLGQLGEMAKAYGRNYLGGCDISEVAINIAQKRVPHATFWVGDAATALNRWEGDTPSTFTLLEMLEHVYEDKAILAALPKGSHVVASVPNFYTGGHVRWFGNTAEVDKRYGKLLKISRIITETNLKGTNQWFVFAGRRL
jgi:2-polyprenyl-3-methyl-5-hydroxy-6-metoxy-1,4-benzoquinol methylase